MGDRQAAIQFFNQAVTAANDKANPQHLNIAYQLFSAASLADPTWIEAHYQLGNANSDLGKQPAAIASWRRALECDGTKEERAKVLNNMGWRLFGEGKLDESIKASLEALKLWPEGYLPYVNLAHAYGLQNRVEEAVEMGRKLMEVAPNDLNSPVVLAFALLFAGKYAEGFKYFESRFEWRLQQYLHFPFPKWNGAPGKVLWLSADQGMGDTFSFCRFLRQACERCLYVHAVVQPELIRPMHYAFKDIANLNIVPSGTPFVHADAWTTFVSLPYALGLSDEEIVNSKPPDWPHIGISDTWKVPNRKLHIGISWKGSTLNDIDKHRSIPMEQFLELYRVPGIQLYSLQVAGGTDELLGAGCYSLIRDLAPHIRDVADTISILDHLDLVITVESALGHICGAIGKPCWIPYSYLGHDYRAGHSGESPLWYRRHRFFKQGADTRWGPVFEKIEQALRQRMK